MAVEEQTPCDIDIAVIGGGPGGLAVAAAVQSAFKGQVKVQVCQQQQAARVYLQRPLQPARGRQDDMASLQWRLQVFESLRRYKLQGSGVLMHANVQHAMEAIDPELLERYFAMHLNEITTPCQSKLSSMFCSERADLRQEAERNIRSHDSQAEAFPTPKCCALCSLKSSSPCIIGLYLKHEPNVLIYVVAFASVFGRSSHRFDCEQARNNLSCDSPCTPTCQRTAGAGRTESQAEAQSHL